MRSGTGPVATLFLAFGRVLATAWLGVAHAIGGGGWALPLDGRQTEEFVLTATQTLLGVAMLLTLRFDWRWATALFVLFAATFVFPSTEARWIVSACYAALAVALFALRARPLARTVTAPFRRLRG